MKINALNKTYSSYRFTKKTKSKQTQTHCIKNNANYTTANLKANFLNFKGNAPKIANAYIITGNKNDIPLLATQKNNSYIVDFDSQTELIYGTDAIKFLNSNDYFNYDTQVIFPKKSQGTILTDGKIVQLEENSAIAINQDSKAKIKVKKGYPLVIISKKDYNWYERYSKDAKTNDIREKFKELMLFNSHLYNGEFSSDILLNEKMRDEKFLNNLGINKWNSRTNLVNEIYNQKNKLTKEDKKEISEIKALLNKMFELGLFIEADDNYIKPIYLFNKAFYSKFLKENGFDDSEISRIVPVLDTIRQAKLDSRFIIRSEAQDYSPETIEKLKRAGILYNNKKDVGNFIFWKTCFSNSDNLRKELAKQGFSTQEQEKIVTSWEKATKTGLDASGLKFINDNLAIYNLDDKLNNWTLEKTNWVTNSTAPTSKNGKTPFIGVSMVQTDKKGAIAISELRKEEKLHSHPNFAEKRQTEVYLVTSGMAALNIVKDGKTQIKILKEGELAIVEAGVAHCINSVLGEYEHIVTQVPSAFQYGFGFKQNETEPLDYDTQRLTQEAFLAFKEN